MFFETLALGAGLGGLLPGPRPAARTTASCARCSRRCSHLRGGDRWLLKSPQHLEQLPVARRRVPRRHRRRDPPRPGRRHRVDGHDGRLHRPHARAARRRRGASAAAWADRIEAMLNACLRDREVLGPERSLDVRFDDFMADDLGTARRVLELADQPFTAEAEAAMRAYLDTPPARAGWAASTTGPPTSASTSTSSASASPRTPPASSERNSCRRRTGRRPECGRGVDHVGPRHGRGLRRHLGGDVRAGGPRSDRRPPGRVWRATGPALEFAVGTGRVALPLSARGVAVQRDRAVAAHGRAAAGQAGRRRGRR